VAAGAGDLLTRAVARVLDIPTGAAEWVKRGPCARVEGPHVVAEEDGGRRFLDRPAGADLVGSLVAPGPAGLLPFHRRLAPAEWRLLRLRLKREVIGANLRRLAGSEPVCGDLLLVGWGSTMGAIEEAVTRLRAEGLAVSSMHLRFLQPMPSGIREILARFKKVMTIEGNWSDKPEDELIDEDNRRYSALAMLLRSRFLVDIDCWSEARGQPIKPGDICRVARQQLQRKGQPQ